MNTLVKHTSSENCDNEWSICSEICKYFDHFNKLEISDTQYHWDLPCHGCELNACYNCITYTRSDGFECKNCTIKKIENHIIC